MGGGCGGGAAIVPVEDAGCTTAIARGRMFVVMLPQASVVTATTNDDRCK
jgi:hypothetical protein